MVIDDLGFACYNQVVWCQDAMRMLGAAEKLREHKTRRLTAVMESSAMLVRSSFVQSAFPIIPSTANSRAPPP